jgi:hexulose-6-phosphate isomerase
MTTAVNRREFFVRSASIAAAGTLLGGAEPRRCVAADRIKKAACIGVLPEGMTVLQRFETAKMAGFEGIEPNTLYAPDEVRQYREASEKTGIRIHSIMNSDHWKYPLTDKDPEVVKKCIEGMQTSMRNAHELGADAVLLVPGIVTADVRYADAYRRSQDEIRTMIPLAKELEVVIAVENVGNRFLLSPLEFARYVDEFKSPWVKAYFDIGNVVSSVYPQDWIRTLGHRIAKVHIKRFEPGADHPRFDPKDRRTQGIDWPDVRKALSEVGYAGWVTAEVRAGDGNYVKEVGARLDRILAGQNPV